MANLNSTIEKSVRRNKDTRDWDAYAVVDGQEHYLGSRETALECEMLCNEYITEQLELVSRPVPPIEPPANKALANIRKTLLIEPFAHIYISGTDGKRVRLMCMRTDYEDDVLFTIDSHEYPALIALLAAHRYQVRPNYARPGVVAEPMA